MEMIDTEHVAKVVGSYMPYRNTLVILTWPVAVCTLDDLLLDIEDLKSNQGNRADILKRLDALELRDHREVDSQWDFSRNIAPGTTKPLERLRQVIGCMARAVKSCHESNVRNLGMRPSNILLSAGRVYLGDLFGSETLDSGDYDKPGTTQPQLDWRVSEVQQPGGEFSMKHADIYSLGLVYLKIATVLYNGKLSDFEAAVSDPDRTELETFQAQLAANARKMPEYTDEESSSAAPRYVGELILQMLSASPAERPDAEEVERTLIFLGGVEQAYHSPCCKRSGKFIVSEVLNPRYAALVGDVQAAREDRDRAAIRIKILEAKDETYETRLRNEQNKHQNDVARLEKVLEEERSKVRQLRHQLNPVASSRQTSPSASGRDTEQEETLKAPGNDSLPVESRIPATSNDGSVLDFPLLRSLNRRDAAPEPSHKTQLSTPTAPQEQRGPRGSQLPVPTAPSTLFTPSGSSYLPFRYDVDSMSDVKSQWSLSTAGSRFSTRSYATAVTTPDHSPPLAPTRPLYEPLAMGKLRGTYDAEHPPYYSELAQMEAADTTHHSYKTQRHEALQPTDDKAPPPRPDFRWPGPFPSKRLEPKKRIPPLGPTMNSDKPPAAGKLTSIPQAERRNQAHQARRPEPFMTTPLSRPLGRLDKRFGRSELVALSLDTETPTTGGSGISEVPSRDVISPNAWVSRAHSSRVSFLDPTENNDEPPVAGKLSSIPESGPQDAEAKQQAAEPQRSRRVAFSIPEAEPPDEKPDVPPPARRN